MIMMRGHNSQHRNVGAFFEESQCHCSITALHKRHSRREPSMISIILLGKRRLEFLSSRTTSGAAVTVVAAITLV